MEGITARTVDDISLLPICILRDDYDGKRRVGAVHVNDVFRPNKKMPGGAIRDSISAGIPFTEYHFHKGVEMLRINDGEATVVIANKAYETKAGDVLIVNPYEAHAIYLSRPEECFSRSCLIFDPDDIFPVKSSENIFSHLKSMRFTNYIPHSEVSDEICGAIDKIVISASGNVDAGAVEALALLMELYSALIRTENCFPVGVKTPYREEFVTRVSDYIERNLYTDISTRSAAAFTKYSDEHFCRLFKTCFGTTFCDYVTECRIAVARRRIDKGELTSISSLAAECGFKSHNHFTNMFRRHTGISPSEYIKGKEKAK